MLIGLLSDTHGCFDSQLMRFFADVDELWHAGDIGNLATADAISAFKPLRAVYGNIDGADVRRVYPKLQRFTCEGVDVLMTHIGGYPKRYEPEVKRLIAASPPTLFIAGHSHILKVIYDKTFQLLHINPGAAGNSGFHQVRTAIRFSIARGEVSDLEVGEWDR